MFVSSVRAIFDAQAAEIGSELVYKLEAETVTREKLRNPSTLADQVGAVLLNAGGGALDIAETMCLSMVAGQVMAEGDSPRLALTFMYPGCALFAALFSFFAVRCSDQGALLTDRHINICWAFRYGLYSTHLLIIVFTVILTGAVYGSTYKNPLEFLRDGNLRKTEGWSFFGVHLIGQLGSILLWESTSFFTSHHWFPTRSVIAAGITGPATMLVQGIGVAMISCLLPLFIVGGVVLCAHAAAGQYGVALASLGFCSPAAFIAAVNSVAPIVCGVDDYLDQSEMQEHRQKSVPLVMAGESQSAEYRGWSVGASMLASFAVMCAFKQESGMATSGNGEPYMHQGPLTEGFSMSNYRDVEPTGARGSVRSLEAEVILEGFVAAWAMTGAFSVFVSGGIITLAIGRATRNLVDETRTQFKEQPPCGVANINSIVRMVVFPAIFGTVIPAFHIILLPVCVGFFAGPRALGAYVVGSILSTGPIATVLFNAGASFAKSKTAIEAEGLFNGIGSDAHLASTSMARAGGAFKDVTAPILCSQIKSMSIWALFMAPTIFISPYMPFVIECAVTRTTYESIFTCMDWNKVHPLYMCLCIDNLAIVTSSMKLRLTLSLISPLLSLSGVLVHPSWGAPHRC
jgi:K(+)-stimulated pyrophosphate-energized sodium pump